MSKKAAINTQRIGKLGELLVQFKLLQCGVESAPMTTDSGIDLVAYGSSSRRARTIQVKANWKPKPGGGKGRPSLDWWIPDDSPAAVFAFVDVSSERVWVLTMAEIRKMAQQHPHGRHHFYMYVESEAVSSRGKIKAEVERFDRFLLKCRVVKLFK